MVECYECGHEADGCVCGLMPVRNTNKAGYRIERGGYEVVSPFLEPIAEPYGWTRCMGCGELFIALPYMGPEGVCRLCKE